MRPRERLSRVKTPLVPRFLIQIETQTTRRGYSHPKLQDLADLAFRGRMHQCHFENALGYQEYPFQDRVRCRVIDHLPAVDFPAGLQSFVQERQYIY